MNALNIGQVCLLHFQAPTVTKYINVYISSTTKIVCGESL